MAANNNPKKMNVGDKPIFHSFEELLAHYNEFREKTVCEENPKVCEPRDVKHVVWDADDTLWNISPYGLAGDCHPPFKKVKEDSVTDASHECLVTLKPNTTDTLRKLNAEGIESSVASNNPPKSVENIIDAMDIRGLFGEVVSDYKHKVDIVSNIVNKSNIKPQQTIFIDDSNSSTREAHEHLGVMPLVMGKDIKNSSEIFRYIKGISDD